VKKNIFLLLLTILVTILSVSMTFAAEQTFTLKSGISIDKVPKEFYGTWRVTSKVLTSTGDGIFKGSCVDLWNLSRVGNVITLDNPFSGAHASISVDEVSDRLIRFSKIGDFDGNKLTDTVELTLGKDSFTGTNYLKLDTVSPDNGHVIKTDKATYRLVGEKISGASIK